MRLPSRGVTLLEILVVIVILTMALGLAVMFLGSDSDLGVRAASNHCVALVRSVAEHARAHRLPAWIVIDTTEQTVSTMTSEIVQSWDFEDARGAFGREAVVTGGRWVPAREGLGCELTGSDTIRCAEVPAYAPDQGVVVSLWLCLSARRSKQIVCTVGASVELSVDGTGRVVARAGEVQLHSKETRLPVDQWVRLRLMVGAEESVLYVNDAEVDARRGRFAWERPAPLIIGSAQDGLAAIVDSVRVYVMLPRDRYYLPKETRVVLDPGLKVAEGKWLIEFTPEGRLDPQRHPAEARFVLRSPAAEKEIRISTLGHVVR